MVKLHIFSGLAVFVLNYMNKFLFNLFTVLLLSAGVFFTSCSDDDDNMVTVKFSAAPMVEGTLSVSQLNGMDVIFTDVRNQDKTIGTLDANGQCEVVLAISTYDIAIEETIKNAEGDDVVVATRMENVSINSMDQKIEAKVNSLPSKALGQNFIFSEIFFNGERNSGIMMHPDQYLVIFNPTNETLYADGLCIAVTMQVGKSDKSIWYDDYYPTKVPVKGFITIPGSGKEHAVAPGERFVIARTAIDHSKEEGYDHAVDLSGADFEMFNMTINEEDVDNPAVPNVIYTNIDRYSFSMHPRGFSAPLMFKLENGNEATINEFVKSHTTRANHFIPGNDKLGTEDETIEIDLCSIPTDMIIDGVQTGDNSDIKTRCIPETVDRGKFLVHGCHRQELAIRKTIKVGDKTYYQDTNNTTEDFIMQVGQNSFPVGWRNK